MKNFLLFTGFLFSFFIGFGQCPSPNQTNSIVFSSQEEINNFAINFPDCTNINYSFSALRIGTTFSQEPSDIVDLSPLSQLESITVENFSIVNNENLLSLSGLENIVINAESVSVSSNDMLINLLGLENLQLGNITVFFTVFGNDSLVNLDGLEGVTNADLGVLNITGNQSLISIDALRNASGFGIVEIYNNPILSDCNIMSICDLVAFQIAYEESEEQPGPPYIYMYNNGESCTDIYITDESCEDCRSTQIVLSFQDAVNDFSINYPDCTDFNYGVLISGNDITDLTPLNGIVSITGGLILEDNPNLQSLTGLESLQFVDEIQIINNPILTDISSLGGLDVQEITNIEIQNNPELSACALDPFCTYLSEGGDFSIANNGADCDSGVVITISCGLELNQMSGSVLYDFNGTGCDTNDYNASNLQIIATNNTNTYSTLTDEQGNYTLLVGTGEVTIMIDQTSLPNNYINTPSSIVQTFNSAGNEAEANFCLEAIAMLHDVSTTLLPLQEPRPGFEASYVVSYSNQGTFVESGEIIFEFDNESVFYIDAEISPNTITASSLTWEYDTLLPFETRTFEVTFELFTPPALIGGEILSSNVAITSVNGDDIPENNTVLLREVVVNSYDPNDKQVLQGAYIFEEEVGGYLDYLVRFQNTGTADAINVVITDELSDNLNWGSFRMLGSSHDYRVEITNGNKVAFIFDDINLPPEEQDEEGSNGFVAFQIRSNDDLVLDDTIENTANIFFDFNEPIITNTVVTTVSEPCPTGITLLSQGDVNLFGVTFSDCTEIDGQLIIEGETITDLSPLSGVTSVVEDIIIRNNPNLTSLIGISNITGTGASIQIINNPQLENLEGLEGVTTLNDMLVVENNDALTSLSGLHNIVSAHEVSIKDNKNLIDLTGLLSLESTEDFSIEGNDALENLSGLNNYAIGESISIDDNLSLTTLDGIGDFGATTLFIHNNPVLVDITGLENMGAIGELLEIINNDALTTLEGLQNLNTIGFGITLSGNQTLTDITALSGLLDPSMHISITNNPNLSVCDIDVVCSFISNLESSQTISITNNATGCDSVAEVEEECAPCSIGAIVLSSQAEVNAFVVDSPDCMNVLYGLTISGNDIIDLSSLSQLTSIEGNLIINDNPLLTNLNGLENLDSFISGRLIISNNPQLSSLQGLGGFGFSTQIINNDSLINLEGLNDLSDVDELLIEENDALQNLVGLDTYTTGLSFVVKNNANISSLEGLENFNSIIVLSLENNPMLADISILQNLTQIAESFEIINNDSLTSLDGLQSGNPFLGFSISGNDALVDITALSDLSTPFSFIEITDNSNLSNCVISLLCDNISNTDLVTITGNASGCDSVAAVEEECLLGVQEELLNTAITIYPNPTEGILNVTFTSDIQLQNIEVFSVAGKKIQTTQETSIDFSSLSRGIYFARIQTDQGTIIKKIVKK